MKKAWLIVALVALGGLAVNTFADVQNIRLSGDIRMRGYYLGNVGLNNKQDQSFISQRTRVSVEADLEDHVLVVVTLKSESLWGANDESFSTSGAGSQRAQFNINRVWDIGIDEAYVQFNEIFYSAATLKLGRQYLHYGHGLILSSTEQEYNYDAGRLVLDYYPLTIDVVGAKLVERSGFTQNAPHGGSDLLFVNARYEMTDSVIKNVEAYFGWVSQPNSSPNIVSTRVPPTPIVGAGAGGASPWIIGVRSDLVPVENLKVWGEGVYEGGSAGAGSRDNIEAFLLNLGAQFTLKDVQWSPAFNASWTWASGGGSGNAAATPGTGAREHTFRPWFDYVDGYNGYLLAPSLANIYIFNVGASVKPSENTTLALQGYYYHRQNGQEAAGSNPNVDFGGLGYVTTQNGSKDLGFEGDLILGYDYSKDVRCQFVTAVFVPDSAFGALNKTAYEFRGEVNVKF